jgi:pimeloyl-ACP methyl ester carboxylesterase
MAPVQHLQLSDALGLARLSINATLGVAELVEELHQAILETPLPVGRRRGGRTSGIPGLVYRSIRGVTRLVGGSLDVTLGAMAARQPPRPLSQQREELLAVLNGVVGDRLAETNNPLAIPMALRRDGRRLELDREALAAAIPGASSRLLVMVHGLCLSDLAWVRRGATEDGQVDGVGSTLAARLERELGMTSVFLHYNSGRHISTNGEELAELLERLVSAWPVEVHQLSIVAHSMGGLVARGACHRAALDRRLWMQRLRHLVFLGTPHQGAPLERGGNLVDQLLAWSPYSAPFARLGRIRSAGITDLRHGNLLDQDWHDEDRFAKTVDRPTPVPLPAGSRSYAIAGTLGPPAAVTGRILGDGLVPVASALGRHGESTRALSIEPSRQWIAEGVGHLELLHHSGVHARVAQWLEDP